MPSEVPPDAEVYQLMLLPVDVAARFEVALAQTVAGVAVAGVGAEGNADTETDEVTELVQPLPLVTV